MDGTGAVRTLDELYAVAEAVLPGFTAMANEIAAAVGGSVTVKVGSLKGRDRAGQKADLEYGDRVPGPADAWLFDIVRLTFVCGSVAEILKTLEMLRADKRVTVLLNGKNRFASPTANGFCDLFVQGRFRVEVAPGIFVEHICEFQIHLRAVTEYAAANGSHTTYEFFRKFFNGSSATVAARMEDLERDSP